MAVGQVLLRHLLADLVVEVEGIILVREVQEIHLRLVHLKVVQAEQGLMMEL